MNLNFLLALVLFASQMPKNDPSGFWQADSGTKYEMRLSGSNLKVKIVPNSNPRFVAYDVDLALIPEDINTYKGKGYFVGKTKSGKECKFETEWQLTVVQRARIFGAATSVTFEPETCEVVEKAQVQLDLKRVE